MSDVEVQATLRAQVFSAIDAKKASYLEGVPADVAVATAKTFDAGVGAVLSTLDEQQAEVCIVLNDEVGLVKLTGEDENGLATSYYARINN